jgi:pyruvate dehydrogenase E2 component (dihydrolipoamide acetyltransferase)
MTVEFKFPDVGEGIHEGTIVKMLVKVGDTVKLDQAILEMETDKAVVELPSPAAGKILSLPFKEGDKVKVGEVLVTIGEQGESVEEKHPVHKAVEKVVEAVKPKPTTQDRKLETEHPATGHRPLASPATRKLARELGVNLELIQGTGPGGRILTEDVRTKASGKVATREGTHVMVKEERITVTTEEGEKRIPLTGLRKTIAERMSYSKTHIPEAVGMDFANVTHLVAIREREKIKAAKAGVHVTHHSILILMKRSRRLFSSPGSTLQLL